MRLAIVMAGLFMVCANSARAQSYDLLDEMVGDMYYTARIGAAFINPVGGSGGLTGFDPVEGNMAEIDTRFRVTNDPVVAVFGGIGLNLGFSFRGEFEGSWILYEGRTCVDTYADGGQQSTERCLIASNDTYGLMLNVYHDFDYIPYVPLGIEPFVGGGAGYTFTRNAERFLIVRDAAEPNLDANGQPRGITAGDADMNESDTILTAIVNDQGLRWGVYGGLTVRGFELMYRYIGGSANTEGHLVTFGYRF